MAGVTISYSGVHQAFQIALAADEAGMLHRFYCSLYNAPNCFGGRLASILGEKRLASRRVNGLDTSRVEEYPWPLLRHHFSNLLRRNRPRDWLKANDEFDRHVADRLSRCGSKLFVGVETCAYHSFKIAHQLGMLNVLDCPGVNAEFLDEMASRAAVQFGLSTAAASDSAPMKNRKHQELALADVIIGCSEFQLKTMHETEISDGRARVIPLWIDQTFWQPAERPKPASQRLRVLFVGKISIRKGIPYLLEAAKSLSNKVELTLVGNIDYDIAPLLKSVGVNGAVLAARPKADLLDIYRAHDVFVLPSLGDSFGIAALEAMACGLPAIVSDHCGVPVPAAKWRVPAMQSGAVVERLEAYSADRRLLEKDSQLAREFASRHTPAQYRAAICGLFSSLLAGNFTV